MMDGAFYLAPQGSDFRNAVRDVCAVVNLPGVKGRFIIYAQHRDRPEYAPHTAHVEVGPASFDRLMKTLTDFIREYRRDDGWEVRLVPAVIARRDEKVPHDSRDSWGRNHVPTGTPRREFGHRIAKLNRLLAEGIAA